MKLTEYKTEFVDLMPTELESGVLYVSLRCEVAIHNCMCGCGEKVVTSLMKGQWNWDCDGMNVTLFPYVGNFQFKCKSHYFLRDGKVVWV